MYFEDLNMMEMFRVSEFSRYLFLEFLPSLSLVIVGNQGCYDLHIFRLKNGENGLMLSREYVFKASREVPERLLGVSVCEGTSRSQIYVCTSAGKWHVI